MAMRRDLLIWLVAISAIPDIASAKVDQNLYNWIGDYATGCPPDRLLDALPPRGSRCNIAKTCPVGKPS